MKYGLLSTDHLDVRSKFFLRELNVQTMNAAMPLREFVVFAYEGDETLDKILNKVPHKKYTPLTNASSLWDAFMHVYNTIENTKKTIRKD